MDGVLIHEENALPGANEFLTTLQEKEIPFLVLTNNSIFTPRDLSARLESAGLIVSARTPSENLCEMIELPTEVHPWFVACQFHPEFTSTPRTGHPLFSSFVRAAISGKVKA